MNEGISQYIIRENIIKIIREFFYAQKFHEVIVPLLNTALPLEPNLKQFATTHTYKDSIKQFYLPMSPERAIKKMLAMGLGNCFAIAQSFRNYEQVGSLHLHEFTMLEWYREDADYTEIMQDMELLLRQINTKMQKKIKMNNSAFPRVSLQTVFKEKIGIPLETLLRDEDALKEVAKKKGYKTDGATWNELFDQIFVNEIENSFLREPFFLIDFPARISPLCKKQKNNPLFADRFELYIHGVEIANGNTENTNVDEIRFTFQQEHTKTGLPIDEEFLSSLGSMQNRSYAGVGVGVNRLTMVYTNTDIFV